MLTSIDYVIIAIFAVSALVGGFRGLIRELLSLLSWVVAVWLSIHYASELAIWLSPYLESPQIQFLVAVALIFVLSLLGLSLIAMLLVKLLTYAGISGTDRTLGALFGLLRGAAISLLLVFVVRLTPATHQPWFTGSVLVPYFDPVFEYLDNQDFLKPLDSLPGKLSPGLS